MKDLDELTPMLMIVDRTNETERDREVEREGEREQMLELRCCVFACSAREKNKMWHKGGRTKGVDVSSAPVVMQ